MTRSEFIDDITEWWHLIDFCNDEECSVCEGVYHEDDIDSMINEDIRDAIACGVGWRDIYYRLENIDDSYGYYVCEGSMDYKGLDNDDFERYKADVLEWMDDNGLWDEEDEDFDEGDILPFGEPADESDDEDDYQEPEEEFSVTELVSMCSLDVTIQQSEDAKKRANEQAEIDRALAELLPLF